MFVCLERSVVSDSNNRADLQRSTFRHRMYLWLCYALFVVATVFISFGVYSKVVSQRPQSNVASREYVVKPGDTLYSIALRFYDGTDLNQYLFRLEQEVPANAEIYPGEVIPLPNG